MSIKFLVLGGGVFWAFGGGGGECRFDVNMGAGIFLTVEGGRLRRSQRSTEARGAKGKGRNPAQGPRSFDRDLVDPLHYRPTGRKFRPLIPLSFF